MSLKEITPKESGFKYNPKVSEICLISDLKFYLNKRSLKFELDQNPHGEPNLTEIGKIEANEDFSQVNFNSNYRDEDINFQITNKTSYDISIFKIIYLVNSGKLNPIYSPNDLDKVEILFSEEQLFQIYLHKYQEYELIDALTITRETDGFYVIKQNPWRKIKLKNISIDDLNIVCNTSEEVVIYPLDVNDFISRIIKELLAVSP